MAEDDLIYIYRLQLTEGCFSFRCNHLQCKSCANFIFSSETKESLLEKATNFAKNHQNENLLCPNFPATLYDYSIFDNVLIFNNFLQQYIKQQKIQNPEKIMEIISDKNSYPFLFSYDLNELDFDSIHPPSELIKDFINAEKHNPDEIKFLEQSFFDRVGLLISSDNELDSLYHLRAIYISLLFIPALSHNETLLADLIRHLMSLLPAAHQLLIEMMSKISFIIPELNKIIQKALINYKNSNKIKKVDEIIWNLSKFIHFILVPANNKSENPIPYNSFSNKEISDLFDPYRELRRFVSSAPTLLWTPSVLTLVMKSTILREGNILTSSTQLKLPVVDSTFKFEDFDKNRNLNPKIIHKETYKRPRRHNDGDDDDLEEEEDFFDILPFGLRDLNSDNSNEEDDDYDIYRDGSDDISVISDSTTVMRRRNTRFRINVRRSNLLDDTLSALLRADSSELIGQIRVEFEDEEGIDLGGISRDFFTTVTNMIFSPDFGMFKLINDSFYWFVSGENAQPLNYYTMLGAFIGVAINNKVVLPIHFPIIMYKKLINYNNSVFNISDYAEIDPESADSLRSLLDSKEKGENIELAGLMFDSSEDYFGSIKTDELIENGSNIAVTNDNVEDYIEKFIDWKLNKSIEKVFNAFKNGYYRVNNTPFMRLFSPEELNELVSGVQELDWKALKESARYSDYTAESQTVKDFWSIFEDDFNEEQRITFLYFVTGIKTAPVGGLGCLRIKISHSNDINLIPMSHTCFNHLVLPDIKCRSILKERMLICISNSEGFGLM